jgi:hypothetical protein
VSDYADARTGRRRGYTPPTQQQRLIGAGVVGLTASVIVRWLLAPLDGSTLLLQVAAGLIGFVATLLYVQREQSRIVQGTSAHVAQRYHFGCNTCGHTWTWRHGDSWPQSPERADLSDLYAAAPPNALRGLKQALLEQDVRLLRGLRGLLPPEARPISTVLPTPNGPSIEAHGELGFGARRIERVLRGGYTSWTVTGLAWNEHPIELTATCTVEGDAAEGLVSALIQLWGDNIQQTSPTTFTISTQDEARAAAFRQHLSEELGEPVATPIPDTLAPHYELLTSPYSHLHVGEVCYVNAVKPQGRIAVETLQAAGRLDLIRNVLRGPNPEGRVYAAQALLTLAQQGTPLNPADAAAIKKIRTQPTPIMVCMGCMVHSEPAAGLLKATLQSVVGRSVILSEAKNPPSNLA